jgi:hypothetical protein
MERTTFRLEAQYLNQLRHHVPPGLEIYIFKILITKPQWKNDAKVPDFDGRITLCCTEKK